MRRAGSPELGDGLVALSVFGRQTAQRPDRLVAAMAECGAGKKPGATTRVGAGAEASW